MNDAESRADIVSVRVILHWPWGRARAFQMAFPSSREITLEIGQGVEFRGRLVGSVGRPATRRAARRGL